MNRQENCEPNDEVAALDRDVDESPEMLREFEVFVLHEIDIGSLFGMLNVHQLLHFHFVETSTAFALL